MHIRRLRIKNVRGFDEVDLDLSRPDGSLAGWTVLAGRNGSGKTTLLKVLALAVAGPTAAKSLQESSVEWIRVGAREAFVGLLLSPSDADQIRFTFTSEALTQPGKVGHYTTKSPLWANLYWQGSDKKEEPKLSSLSREFRELELSNRITGEDNTRQPSPQYTPPRDALEEKLAAIWENLLGIKKIGILDSFFDLGGHSLLATRLLHLIQKEFGTDLPLRSLFESPNVAGIASEIARYSGLWIDNPTGWFIVGYGPYRRLTGHTSSVQHLMSGSNSVARLVNLFREDASLIECISWLREVYLRRLEEKPGAGELERAILALLNDGLLPDGVHAEKVDSEGLWVVQREVSLPIHQLSDGYRTIATLVIDIARHLHQSFGQLAIEYAEDLEGGYRFVPHEGVVLIDEVDLHLHVSWQKRIGFWLKRHFPNIQFIVTTHSPFVCQAADPRGLIRLPAPGENRSVEHVSESLYNTVVNGSIDDAVLTELFGLETPYSHEAERLREQVAELEAKLQTEKITANEKSELRDLQSRLPKTLSSDVEQALRKLTSER